MKNTFSILIAGWATVTVGLFLAVVAGNIVEDQFSITGDGRLIVQAVVMSMIVVPIILFLYKQLHSRIKLVENPSFSRKRAPHFFTGFFVATGLALIGLFIASALNLISIEQWHAPNHWIGALLLNMLIAFFYEALPEELALRGLVFDVLRNRLAVWLSVIIQTFIFVAVSVGVTLLQTMIGMATIDIAIIPQLMLLFVFGIALALIRVYTGSLWAAIGFHLGYLAMARFFIMPAGYGAPPIVTFQEETQGLGSLFMIGVMMFGSIVIFLLLLVIRRSRKKQK
ncbi:lysostaphin resistance A-like protein [Virgibacillus oceani]